MASSGKKLLSLHYVVVNFFLHLLFIFEAANAKVSSTGLSMKLIHRDSIESPFYPGNITRTERIELLLARSASGVEQKTINTTMIRPKMDNQGLMYMVQIGIGTFASPRSPYYNYFLHLDTASDLIWTQCDECRRRGRGSCFRQKPPLFPAAQSRSYRPLPCDRHALCIPGECIGATCSYFLGYADGATTLGYLAQESFAFASDKNKTERVKDIVFGCGIKNKGFQESSKTNVVAGNFGLGPGKFSFLRQKMSLTQGRFSYCLPPWDTAHNFTVFLRFGADIPLTKGLKTAPMSKYPGSASYFVELKGVSVGDTRLDIPPEMLARRNKRHGGCSVDSGSSITILPPPVYGKLKEMLIKNHFSGYKPTKNLGSLHLCYLFPPKKELKHLPNITFHLQDSDLVFPPQLGYISDITSGKKYFCLAMISEDIDGMTIVGAFQQANTRFIFDTVKQKLYFGPEDCTLGA